MKYLEGSFSVPAPGTEEYRDNHERIFGEKKPNQRGRWIWDDSQQKLVRAEDYVPPSYAKDASIVTDRWYEGTRTLDGTDIGSRRKREEYMRSRGLQDANDFSPAYYERQRADQARAQKAERRAVVEEMYRRHKSTPTVERLAPRGVHDE